MEYSKEPHQEMQQQLESLIPGVENLEKAEQMQLHGLVRRAILQERQAGEEAVNIFKPEDTVALKTFKDHLPHTTEVEKEKRIEELGLDEEEAIIESSHWAFRHQSNRGEMMVGEKLVSFQMIRVSEFQFLLLVAQQNEEVMRAFIPVFEKAPDISSIDAFCTETQIWAGWIWLTDSDDLRVAIQKEQIKAMWEGSKDDLPNNHGK